VAVSANVPAAIKFGIAATQIYPMWDWVGGRYSVWSAVGLSAALAIGMPAFDALLDGAQAMDQHFRHTPWSENLPWLMAWTGVIHRNFLGRAACAVVPYDHRLRLLPAYLQQLEMESLGKSVQTDGEAVQRATVAVLLPGLGTDVQHAFFQALHQGTEVVPVDFIGVLRPDHSELAQHEVLLSHLFAQSAALLRGRTLQEARAGLTSIADPQQAEIMAAQRVFPGNRPSTTLLLERLDPASLGSLLALYEHKVYVQSVLWGINAFDQWGVELGKQIAMQLLPLVRGESSDVSGLDVSTTQLLAKARAAHRSA
jgi:glucose-6-phosphate isomerase